MGWKGTVRSIQAANNQARREVQRHQRDYERQQVQLEKMAELERAAVEVEIFDDHMLTLETLHGTEVAEVDWAAIANSPEPAAPTRSDTNEGAAKKALDGFKPKVLESKKRQAVRKSDLSNAVADATNNDDLEYERATRQHVADLEQWSNDRELANGILTGEIEAFAEASRQIEGFAGGEYLRFLEFTFSDEDTHSVTIGVVPIEDVIPDKQKSLLASGKLSEKAMPKGRYNELYQDYVCGASLLVANAVLGMLPIDALIVNAQSEMLNTATGHIEDTTILSLFVPRETIGRLNLAMVDASDAMANFMHSMKFLKTKGFQAIEPVAPPTPE